MLIPVLALSGVYLAALVWLLWIAKVNKSLYALAKGVCSALFLVCAAMCWLGGGRREPLAFGLLAGGMVLCAFGDVFLGVANRTAGRVSKKPFLAGAASFTLAHVLFCAMFILRGHTNWYDLVFPVILMAVLWLLERADRIRLKKLRPVGYLYTFMVALMAWKAAQGALGQGFAGQGELLMGVGAALFLVSDVILLFLYFGTKRYAPLRGINLVTYYVGVYLMGIGAYWL